MLKGKPSHVRQRLGEQADTSPFAKRVILSESKLIEAGNTALAAMESARPKPGLEVVAAFLRMVFSLTIPRRAAGNQDQPTFQLLIEHRNFLMRPCSD